VDFKYKDPFTEEAQAYKETKDLDKMQIKSDTRDPEGQDLMMSEMQKQQMKDRISAEMEPYKKDPTQERVLDEVAQMVLDELQKGGMEDSD